MPAMIAIADTTPQRIGGNVIKNSETGELYNPSIPPSAKPAVSSTTVVVGSSSTPRPKVAPTPPKGPRDAARPVPSPPSARTPKPHQHRDRLFTRLGNSYAIPTDEDALREIFQSWDLNTDGKISAAEFVSEYIAFEASRGLIVSQRQANELFARGDTNNDRFLSFGEFVKVMAKIRAKC